MDVRTFPLPSSALTVKRLTELPVEILPVATDPVSVKGTTSPSIIADAVLVNRKLARLALMNLRHR